MGSLRWMEELGVALGAAGGAGAEAAKQGATVSALAERTTDGPGPACNDGLWRRAQARGARGAGGAARARHRTVMISGDNRGAAEAMARGWGWTPRRRGDGRGAARRQGGQVVALQQQS
jgi:Cu+-exporting ATPase